MAVITGTVLLFIAGSATADAAKPDPSSAGSLLAPLLLQGPEMHPELRAKPLEDIKDKPREMVLPKNPHLSGDRHFIERTARGGSQGRLDGHGMRSALYARYATDEFEIGFYGLEAQTAAAALDREIALRDIWSRNVSVDRTRVHRKGLILVVVWLGSDGQIPELWHAVNATVLERLNRPLP